MNTTLENRISILSDFWMTFRDDESFEDIINYCDIALPLAYAVDNGIVKITDKAQEFIDEAFELLLTSRDIEDTGFETLDELLDPAE